MLVAPNNGVTACGCPPPVPSVLTGTPSDATVCPRCHQHPGRGRGRAGGSQWGWVTPRWALGWVTTVAAMPVAKGPCLAPTEAAAASRPRAGKAPLGWNICSMRSWFAETARSPRQRLREVTRPGVTAGRWLLVAVPVSPTPARVLCRFGDTLGTPHCGAVAGFSPSMGHVPGRSWALPPATPLPSEGAPLSPGLCRVPPGRAVPLPRMCCPIETS